MYTFLINFRFVILIFQPLNWVFLKEMSLKIQDWDPSHEDYLGLVVHGTQKIKNPCANESLSRNSFGLCSLVLEPQFCFCGVVLLQEAITDGLEIAVSPRSLHSELMCPICLDMLKNTMTTKECLHRFCADCIITALRSGWVCVTHRIYVFIFISYCTFCL